MLRLIDVPSRFPTSLEAFIEKFGEPIDCDGSFADFDLDHTLNKYDLDDFRSVIERYQSDPQTGVRHWPVIAFSANQYAFLKRELSGYPAEPSPSELKALLTEIVAGAAKLERSMMQLANLAARLEDGVAPLARPHQEWLWTIIEQASAGVLSSEAINDPRSMLAVEQHARDFHRRLVDVGVAATYARQRLDPPLLTRRRPQQDRALKSLVSKSKVIWVSLTGRVPSVNSVHLATRERRQYGFGFCHVRQGTGEPSVADGTKLTAKQIQTAFG